MCVKKKKNFLLGEWEKIFHTACLLLYITDRQDIILEIISLDFYFCIIKKKKFVVGYKNKKKKIFFSTLPIFYANGNGQKGKQEDNQQEYKNKIKKKVAQPL